MIRLITQDNGRLPIFDQDQPPVFIMTDEEIEGYLTMCNGDVLQAARWAMRSMMNWVSSISTKELCGDIEVWTDFGKNYIKAGQAFLDDKTLFSILPKGVMPYAAGISVTELIASLTDPDNPRKYSIVASQFAKSVLEAYPYDVNISNF